MNPKLLNPKPLNPSKLWLDDWNSQNNGAPFGVLLISLLFGDLEKGPEVRVEGVGCRC